jgi:hypothetical protein
VAGLVLVAHKRIPTCSCHRPLRSLDPPPDVPGMRQEPAILVRSSIGRNGSISSIPGCLRYVRFEGNLGNISSMLIWGRVHVIHAA